MTARIWKTLVTVAVVLVVVTASLYFRRRYRLQALPSVASAIDEPTGAEFAHAFHTRLSASERQHVLDGDFEVVRSTDKLPVSIKNMFAALTEESRFALAEPGHKYQETDVIEEPGLLTRRMEFAGHCKQRWFIYYAHGGIGLSYAVIVLDIRPDNTAHFLWGGSGFRSVANLDDLRSAIAAGTFADDRNFYW
jgi:hypothetical protein